MNITKMPPPKFPEQEYNLVITESELYVLRVLFGGSNPSNVLEQSCFDKKGSVSRNQYLKLYDEMYVNICRMMD